MPLGRAGSSPVPATTEKIGVCCKSGGSPFLFGQKKTCKKHARWLFFEFYSFVSVAANQLVIIQNPDEEVGDRPALNLVFLLQSSFDPAERDRISFWIFFEIVIKDYWQQ